MRRFLLLLLTLALTLCLASCGKDKKENESVDEDSVGGEVNAEENTLAFEKTLDGRFYTVVGIGTYTSEHLVIPSTYLGVAVESVSDGAFSNNVNIRTLTVESGVKKIGASAFSGCTALQSVDIASTLQKIGSSAFESCTSLKTLIFGSGVTDIGKNTFLGCPVESFYYEGTQKDLSSITGMTWCELDYGVKYLYYEESPAASGYFWHRAENGSPLVWEDHIGTEGLRFALSDDGSCYKVTGIASLTEKIVVIPRAHKDLPVGEIDSMAFVGSYMREITIPDTVTKIHGAAFKMCAYLTSVKLPEDIEYIGENAFSGCSALKIVFLPEAVKNVGGGAFSDSVKIYYEANAESFAKISVTDGDSWLSCVYFYSASEPIDDGNYWYFSDGGSLSEW